MSNEEETKGDPNGTRLFARVLDKIDATLFDHGMEFCEDKSHEKFCELLAALLFEYYTDLTGGDESYDPNEPEESGDSEESLSESLEDESPPLKKLKK